MTTANGDPPALRPVGAPVYGGSEAQGPPDAAVVAAMLDGTHPHATRIMAEVVHDDDAEFAFGLDLILDGLERARDREGDAAG